MNRIPYSLAAVVFALGCSSAGAHKPEGAGAVNLALETNGVVVNSMTYKITGDHFTRTSVVNVTNSKRISALIGGLPPGYFEVSLSATDVSDETMRCNGFGAFTIFLNETVSLTVNLYCRRGSNFGSVAINGAFVRCPESPSISAEPSEAPVGETISLEANAEDTDSLFLYHWDATSGILSDADSRHATLICVEPGAVSVNLTVSSAEGSCGDTATGTVYCSTEDDPNTPGDDRVDYVSCFTQSCSPGFGCCGESGGCAASPEECGSSLGFRSCDGPEDCPPGTLCANQRHYTSCGAANPVYGIACHKDSDCISTPESPNPCRPGGGCDFRD
ncbi:MAG TPA: PKD domain-containing protein [Polyangiaceae bacterium]|nr:PKD domain-containing protein [Polyangiaceae bacterium]